ncbi:hypothetical protein ACFWM0_23605 [Streptomyces sp. NPDC058405]|uniref:hypothetical protein n=1 Tax=Streptomyces sp. NPDC058405 TaxID=3346482 RepID=UPI003663587A
MHTSPTSSPASGSLVAEHRTDQFQGDREADFGAVVGAGEVGWEEPGEAVARDRGLYAEVNVAGDGRVADL